MVKGRFERPFYFTEKSSATKHKKDRVPGIRHIFFAVVYYKIFGGLPYG